MKSNEYNFNEGELNNIERPVCTPFVCDTQDMPEVENKTKLNVDSRVKKRGTRKIATHLHFFFKYIFTMAFAWKAKPWSSVHPASIVND